VAIDMCAEEAAVAVGSAPHEWSLNHRTFAPWPEEPRGGEVKLPTVVAGEPERPGIWNMAP
jgi:hypothetical protein